MAAVVMAVYGTVGPNQTPFPARLTMSDSRKLDNSSVEMTSAPLGRRELLTRAGALLAGAATSAALAGTRELGAQQAAPAQPVGRELYELRTYRTTNGPRAAALGDYFRDALVPALRRHGTGPVGVFTVAIGEASPSYHVLIPHASAESLVRVA